MKPDSIICGICRNCDVCCACWRVVDMSETSMPMPERREHEQHQAAADDEQRPVERHLEPQHADGEDHDDLDDRDADVGQQLAEQVVGAADRASRRAARACRARAPSRSPAP